MRDLSTRGPWLVGDWHVGLQACLRVLVGEVLYGFDEVLVVCIVLGEERFRGACAVERGVEGLGVGDDGE